MKIVYALLDPRKLGVWMTSFYTFMYEPFYIGEGKISRPTDHLKDETRSHKTNRIKEIILENLQPIVVILAENLSKDESIDIETQFIKELGTRQSIDEVKRGPLTNQRLYGKRGTISDETKAKMSASKRGIKFTTEHRAKLSSARKGRSYTRKKADKPMSQEQRQKLSIAMKGRTFSPESLQKMSIAQRGRTLTIEQRKKIGIATKGRESPNRKDWKIEFSNGNIIIVDKLRQWCESNDVKYSSLRNTLYNDKFYNDMKLVPCEFSLTL